MFVDNVIYFTLYDKNANVSLRCFILKLLQQKIVPLITVLKNLFVYLLDSQERSLDMSSNNIATLPV